MNRHSYEMDVEQLILAVKENSALYDSSDKNHRNRSYISSVWRKIAADLCFPEDATKEKWHQLRSNYMRAKRNLKGKTSGSGAKATAKWPYFDMLSFLDPCIETRETSCNVDQLQEQLQQPDEPDSETGPTPSNENVSSAGSTSAANTGNPESTLKLADNNKNRFKRRNEAALDEVDMQYLEEFKKFNSTRADKTDPDRMFLLSLLPSMKQLTSADSMDFKIQMLQSLNNKLFPTTTLQNWQHPKSPQNLNYYRNGQQQWPQFHDRPTSPGSSPSHCSSTPPQQLYQNNQ